MPTHPQIDKSEELTIPIEKKQIIKPKIIYAKGHSPLFCFIFSKAVFCYCLIPFKLPFKSMSSNPAQQSLNLFKKMGFLGITCLPEASLVLYS